MGFFNTQDHTAVVIIIAGFNVNRTTSFVYTLLCSSRKSNYSQRLFSPFITIPNNRPYGLYFALWFIRLFYSLVCERYIIYFYYSFGFYKLENFLWIIIVLLCPRRLQTYFFISGENEEAMKWFTGNFRLILRSH